MSRQVSGTTSHAKALTRGVIRGGILIGQVFKCNPI